jgi:hypothetical protein
VAAREGQKTEKAIRCVVGGERNLYCWAMGLQEPELAYVRLKGEGLGRNVPMDFTVYGGLHAMGKQKPYFSLTYWAHRAGFENQLQEGGANHEEILKRFPQFADLAKLHLADIDGVPMHVVANGWYWLKGALGLEGSAAASGWRHNDHEGKTQGECLKIFAALWRLSPEEAEAILVEFDHDDLRGEDWDSKQHEAQLRLKGMAEEMKPRWKQEALACIARHNLQVYGDRQVSQAAEAVEDAAVTL